MPTLYSLPFLVVLMSLYAGFSSTGMVLGGPGVEAPVQPAASTLLGTANAAAAAARHRALQDMLHLLAAGRKMGGRRSGTKSGEHHGISQ